MEILTAVDWFTEMDRHLKEMITKKSKELQYQTQTLRSEPGLFTTIPQTNQCENNMADSAMRGEKIADASIEEDDSVEEEFRDTGEATIIGCEKTEGDWAYLVKFKCPRMIRNRDNGIFWQTGRVGDLCQRYHMDDNKLWLVPPVFWRESRMLPRRWRRTFWSECGARLGCIGASQHQGFMWDSHDCWYSDAKGFGNHLCMLEKCNTCRELAVTKK